MFEVGDMVTGGIMLYKVLSIRGGFMTVQCVGKRSNSREVWHDSEIGKIYQSQFVSKYTLVSKKPRRNLPDWF